MEDTLWKRYGSNIHFFFYLGNMKHAEFYILVFD